MRKSSLSNKNKQDCCCSCLKRYRVRAIPNAPTVLILVWNCLIWTIIQSPNGEKLDQISFTVTPGITTKDPKDYLLPFLMSILWISSAFASVWLVGWKMKYSDIIFTGLLITSIGVLLDNLVYVIAAGTISSTAPTTAPSVESSWVIGFHAISLAIISIGSAFVITNLLQLALEQSPGASAHQVSSLASWFVVSTTFGTWLAEFTGASFKGCTSSFNETPNKYLPCLKLVFAILMTLLVSSYLLLRHRLLDNFPITYASQQIYQVLKYALKHKVPQRRSALTYWEDKPPSRLNLGKSKYGGPFTNEQVEDVRTFCQMNMLSLSIFFLLLTVSLNESTAFNFTLDDAAYPEWPQHQLNLTHATKTCKHSVFLSFTVSTAWWQLVFTLLHELVLAPAFSHRLPSMLQRMGFAGGMAMVTSAFLIFVSLADSNTKDPPPIPYLGVMAPTAVLIGFKNAFFYTASLEFICAQSPYNMRNFFISLGYSIFKSSALISVFVSSIWNLCCTKNLCPIIYSIGTMLLAAAGLVAFCLSARWYRKRTRGHEDEHQQQWVEDAYDKYIEDNMSSKETFWITEK